jgi:outer membrane biogenesis lipoprotein LolB
MKTPVALAALALLSACGVETVGTAAIQAETRKQEGAAAKQLAEQYKQQSEAALKQAEQRLREAEGGKP